MANNFIISPYAISYNSIKNALQAYINDKSASSVLDTWSDFYTAGAGQTIVELDAAVAAFYAFHFIIGRREAYLPVAQNYTSIIGGAETLGYSASRGHNVHLYIKVLPSVTQTLPKWSVIGSFQEYDVVLLNTTTLTKDNEIELECVIGNSLAQGITITSNEIQQFTFTAEDTTDDCRLILTDTEVPMATTIEEAVEDKYIMLTNSYGSVDVFYLNQNGNSISYSVISNDKHGWTITKGNAGETVPETALIYSDLIRSNPLKNNGTYTYTGSKYESNYCYKAQDTLYLQYIQRNNLKYSDVVAENIAFDYGDVIETTLISDNKEQQDKDSIKLGASVYHETNHVVRARKDYAKFLQQDNNLNLIDVNDFDVNPGLIGLTYLRKKDSNGARALLSDKEKETFMKKVEKATPDGAADIFIVDPMPVARTLKITLWQKSDEMIPTNIDDYIQEIIDEYDGILQCTIDFEAIEHALEKIAGVKIARVEFDTLEYNVNTKYKEYDVIEVPDIEVGNEAETWRMLAVRILAKSGESSPDWESAQDYGNKVEDNNILWEKSNMYVNAIPYKWQDNKDYSLYADVATGATVFPKQTTATEPTWHSTIHVNGNVTFNRVKAYDTELDEWESNSRCTMDEYRIMVDDDKQIKAVYQVSDLTHKSGAETPDWNDTYVNTLSQEVTVMDNALTWQLMYDGYKPTETYNLDSNIAVLVDNKIYIYNAVNTATPDTIYNTTNKTGAEAIPFIKNENDEMVDIIYAMVEEDVSESTGVVDEVTGLPISEVVTQTVQGDPIWQLMGNLTLDNTEWTALTEIPLQTITFANNQVFKVIDNNDCRTGDVNWFENQTEIPEEFEDDNNVKWVLDTYTVNGEERKASGRYWLELTEYEKGEKVIVHASETDLESEKTCIYEVVSVSDAIITKDQVIFTVCNFIGQTGETEPTWTYSKKIGNETEEVGYDYVVDNDILWTKTTDISVKGWTEETIYHIGDVINPEDGVYYKFTSLVGTSGTQLDEGIYEEPAWSSIVNGEIIDNNIVWQKMSDNTTINLKWNEYLDLKYELNQIK